MVSNYGQKSIFCKRHEFGKTANFFSRCSVFSHHFILHYGIHGQIVDVYQSSVDVLQSMLFNQCFSIDVSQSMFFNQCSSVNVFQSSLVPDHIALIYK